MPTLDELRQLYPATQDLSDLEMVRRLSYNTGMSFDDTAGFVGYKPRNAAAEIVRQGAASAAVDLPAMVNKMGAAIMPDGSAAEQMFRDNAANWEADAPKWEPDLHGRGPVASTLIKGARAFAPSAGAMALTLADPLLGGAAVAALFGGSAFTDTWEKGRAAGLPDEELRPLALKTAAIQGIGEAATDAIGGRLLFGAKGLMEAGRAGGLSGAVRAATDPRWAGQFARNWGADAALQSGTEFAQDYSTAALERNAGIDNADPMAQGLESAQAALGLSALLGPLSAASHFGAGRARGRVGEVLHDPHADLEQRLGAGLQVHDVIKQRMGQQAADSWLASFNEGAVQDRDALVAARLAQHQPLDLVDAPTGPPLALPDYSRGPFRLPDAIVFPDGSVTTSQADVEDYLARFPEEQRVGVMSALLGRSQPAPVERPRHQPAPLPGRPAVLYGGDVAMGYRPGDTFSQLPITDGHRPSEQDLAARQEDARDAAAHQDDLSKARTALDLAGVRPTGRRLNLATQAAALHTQQVIDTPTFEDFINDLAVHRNYPAVAQRLAQLSAPEAAAATRPHEDRQSTMERLLSAALGRRDADIAKAVIAGMPQQDVASIHGVTPARISQILSGMPGRVRATARRMGLSEADVQALLTPRTVSPQSNVRLDERDLHGDAETGRTQGHGEVSSPGGSQGAVDSADDRHDARMVALAKRYEAAVKSGADTATLNSLVAQMRALENQRLVRVGAEPTSLTEEKHHEDAKDAGDTKDSGDAAQGSAGSGQGQSVQAARTGGGEERGRREERGRGRDGGDGRHVHVAEETNAALASDQDERPDSTERARREWDEMRADGDPSFDHLPDHLQQQWEDRVERGEHSGAVQGEILDRLEIERDSGSVNYARTDGTAMDRLMAAVKRWKQVVADYLEHKLDSSRTHVLLPTTPASMQLLGMPNLEVRIGMHALSYANIRLTRAQMEDLPRQLAQPELVYAHGGRDGWSLNFVTEYGNAGGRVVVALRPNQHVREPRNAHYVATILDVPLHVVLREVRAGHTLFAGDMADLAGAREALNHANRENGRQASEVRRTVADSFGLSPVLTRVMRQSDLVKLVESGKADYAQAGPSGSTLYTSLGAGFDHNEGTGAAHWLAANAKQSWVRDVARRIARHVLGTEIVVVREGSAAPQQVLAAFKANAIGAAATLPDGRRIVWLNGMIPEGLSQENLLHELLHSATRARLDAGGPARAELEALAATVRRSLAENFDPDSHAVRLFMREFEDVNEFVAYTFSSTTMRQLMAHLDADGHLRLDSAARTEQARASRPNLLQRFVEALRRLFGLPRIYADRLAKAVDVGPAERAGGGFEQRVNTLLDRLLAEPAPFMGHSGPEHLREGDAAGRSAVAGRPAAQPVAGLNRAQFEASLERLVRATPALRQTQSAVTRYVKSMGEKGLMAWQFGHQLAKQVKDLLPSSGRYFAALNEKLAARMRREERVAAIARRFYAMPREQQRAANELIFDATTEQQWPYAPAWDPALTPDPALAQRYAALSAEAQAAVREVFDYGRTEIHDRERAINRMVVGSLKAQLDAAEKAGEADEASRLRREISKTIRAEGTELAKIQGPYAPLKRFGDHAVVAKSAQYLEAEAAGDAKRLRELEKDEANYYVEFVNGKWEAARRAQQIEQAHPGYAEVYASERMVEDRRLDGLPYQTISRLKEAIGASFESDHEQAALRRHLEQMAEQLYIGSLNALNVRKSELKRRNIAGADRDMMRAFVTQGRANAALIASLESHQATSETLLQLKREAKSGDRMRKSAALNEILRRHIAALDYRDTPVQDTLMKVNSVWMLLTSPAYYLANTTQPFLMSLPMMTGRHGAGTSWRAFLRAYGETVGSIRFKPGQTLDVAAVDKLDGNVGRERDMVQQLLDRNHMDIGIDTDLGDTAQEGTGASRTLNRVARRLRGVANTIEVLNRLSTALAAYRLEYTRQTNAGAGAEAAHRSATEYADDVVVATHGDYSAHNAPRLLMQGNYAHLPVKVMGQFKKFMLIQWGLVARAAREGFAGATKEERAAGRTTLAWLLGSYTALAGLLGAPAFRELIMPLLGAVFGGDGEDDEAYLRRIIGDPDLARLLLRGVPALAGVDLSRRLGLSLNPLPYVDAGRDMRETFRNTLVALFGGPSAALAEKGLSGIEMISRGEYWKGLESLVPNGVAGILKALRYASEGVTSSRGDVVLTPDEVGVIGALFQAAGLPPTSITERSWKSEVLHSTQEEFAGRAAELRQRYTRAAKEHDAETQAKLRGDWKTLQDAQAQLGFARSPLSQLLRAPREQAKHEAQSVAGLPTNKGNRNFVRRLAAL